jgi:hypothetical protein
MPVTNMFRKKAMRDAELIKKEAKVVVFVDENFNVSVEQNDQGKISVIGIIGPGTSHNGFWLREALLEEIGVSCSRPYQKGNFPENLQIQGEIKSFPPRYSGFFFSQKQYLATAPAVFGVIQELADKRVAGWKSGTPDKPFYLPGAKVSYSRSAEKIVIYSSKKGFVAVESGARFSVALDSQFVPDIFWAGYESVRKLSSLINMRLEHRLSRKRKKILPALRRRSPAIFVKKRKNINELKRFGEVVDLINKSPLPKWLLPGVLECLPGGRNNRFAAYLEQVLPLWQEESSLAWQSVSSSLPGIKVRIGNMRLALRSLNNRKNYAVFEVMPGKDWRKYAADCDENPAPPDFFSELTPEEVNFLPF